MSTKDGWARGMSRLGSFVVLAATVCFSASVFPLAVAGEDATAGVGGQRPAGSAARILLREGAAPDGAASAVAEDTAAVSRSAEAWSDAGLEARPGMTAAGGMMVPLRGRYRSSVVLRRGTDGTASVECNANLPERGGAN